MSITSVPPVQPHTLRTTLVAILECLDDDLRLRRTPEGLMDLRLQRFDAAMHREAVLRIGTAEELQNWAQEHMRQARQQPLQTERDTSPFLEGGLATLVA
ncbi:MAG: hypothetical protein ACYCS8_06560 [Acidithiobacillus sp.]